MQPRLAILLTYYNEKCFLRECLESLLSQEERPNEVLIYDDASIYPAKEYVGKFFSKDLNIEIIRGATNVGPSRGRNILLRAAQSDFIHFHDSDDLFLPNWYSRVRSAIIGARADVVFTEITSYRDGRQLSSQVLGLTRLVTEKDLIRFCIQGSMLVPAGTYRRKSVMGIGGYREALQQSEDFDFHIRLAATRPRYVVIEDPLVSIRVRPESRSQRTVEVWSSALKAIELLAFELPAEYRLDLAEAAARAGSALYKLGAKVEAGRAFALARKLGPVRFPDRPDLYRLMARHFGQEFAERLSSRYRQFMPETIRRFLISRP